MVEAVIATLTADPEAVTGLDTTSIEFLVELDRPVRDLAGTELVPGWQPPDLVRYLRAARRRGL